jgi:hypothetical protein
MSVYKLEYFVTQVVVCEPLRQGQMFASSLLLLQLALEGIELTTFPPCQYTLKMIIAMRMVSFEGALQPSVVPVA